MIYTAGKSERLSKYRLLRGFRGSVDDSPLHKRPPGEPGWHMYDDRGSYIATFTGDSAAAIQGAMRVVIDRDDFGTGDWFLVGDGEYEFQLNAIGLFLRAGRAQP